MLHMPALTAFLWGALRFGLVGSLFVCRKPNLSSLLLWCLTAGGVAFCLSAATAWLCIIRYICHHHVICGMLHVACLPLSIMSSDIQLPFREPIISISAHVRWAPGYMRISMVHLRSSRSTEHGRAHVLGPASATEVPVWDDAVCTFT
jgi:hypothetical protein